MLLTTVRFLDQVMLFNSFTSCLRSECIFNFPTFARFIRIDVAFILLIVVEYYPVYFAFEDDDINVVLADIKKNDVTFGAWTLELSACWLSGSLQLLPECCFCIDALLTIYHPQSHRILALHLAYNSLRITPRFIWKVIHQNFWPSDIQIAREAEIS
ncbi:hypothetical protein LOK49_LG02G00780 [Camellia lanceoleosa]|uniref:Uncharacterized protein n=1 Tax=Camellia lanceoleosa TaxID=1840588 RepID=A0ACC0ISX3_9ERIC|nr:hypothetical protein LOK49_LG02G00780 [Camellia lanceoleosa]